MLRKTISSGNFNKNRSIDCADCIHYSHTPGDTPRCTKFPVLDILDVNVKYVETSVARFDDFNLCGPSAMHFVEKIPSNSKTLVQQPSTTGDL